MGNGIVGIPCNDALSQLTQPSAWGLDMDNSIVLNNVTFKPNFFLVASDAVTPGHFTYGDISKTTVKLCESSWIKIVSGSIANHQRCKIHVFFDTFFRYFQKADVNKDCVDKFQVHPKSYIPNRDALLLRVMKYLLSVPNDSFKVKTKLRSLGRAHARYGIEEKHFRVFAQALMMTLIECMGRSASYSVVKAWSELLSFVLHQMSFDKVFFIPRVHEPEFDKSNSFHYSPMSDGSLDITEELVDRSAIGVSRIDFSTCEESMSEGAMPLCSILEPWLEESDGVMSVAAPDAPAPSPVNV
jgi:hemoglobin-like flavoprotein